METQAPRKRRNRSRTTELLLQAAADCIVKHGPPALTISSVSQRAGYDKVLIYRYFQSIDGLREALADAVPLYPSATDTIDAAQKLRGNPLEAIATALQQQLEEMPVAHTLISHRWHANKDPLATGLARARSRWLDDMSSFARNLWPTPDAIAIVQLLAEESTATQSNLIRHFNHALPPADHWTWPDSPTPSDSNTPDPSDTLPDNLL